ncbi:MAG: GNAT family N-acetyltransferase [Gammaproteobacteria bacterium]
MSGKSGAGHNAYWDRSSTPFVIKHNNEVIAHVGLLPFDFIIQENSFRAAALHGICTKNEFRRKGHFKQLMQEALDEVKQHFDFAFLFTDKPYLYEQFGFKVVKEYDFIYAYSKQNAQKNKSRILDLDDPRDLLILQNHYQNRVPLSKMFSIVNEITVATLNALHMPVCYLEELDVLVVYQINDQILYVKDIIATKPCELDLILNCISNHHEKIVLQFIPDRFLKLPANPVEALTDGCIMISEHFDLNWEYFRYPEPQRC